MRLLAADATGNTMSLALGGEGRTWSVRRRGGDHDEKLWPVLRGLLKRAGWRLEDLDAVACSTGPGRFTGVRVGLAFASTLAASLEIPAVGVSFLEAAAWQARARADAPPRFCVRLPAGHRKGEEDAELYLQAFGPGAPGKPLWTRASEAGPILARLTRGGKDPVLEPGAAFPWPLEARHLLEPARAALEAGRPGPCAPLYLKPANFQLPRS